MTLEAECRPAFDYARREHAISIGKKGMVFKMQKISLRLATDVPLEEGPVRWARARFTLREGERATFV